MIYSAKATLLYVVYRHMERAWRKRYAVVVK